MDEAISRFLRHMRQVRGSAQNTIAAYHGDLRQFHHYLLQVIPRPVDPGEISGKVLVRYLEWLNAQRYRPATISRKMATLRAFLSYLREHEGSSASWSLDQLRPPSLPARRPRVLTRSELDALLSAPLEEPKPRHLRDAAILALLYSTGLRVEQVSRLDVGRVDLIRSRVMLEDRMADGLSLGRASHAIRVYLHDARPQLARDPRVKALFLNQRGERLSRQGIWLVVKRWASRAGLGHDVSPHTLRHSLAAHMLRRGESRRDVQQKLGLASPSAIRIHAQPQRPMKGIPDDG